MLLEIIRETTLCLESRMCFGVRVGMQREHTFLFREKKVNLSQSETGYFKIGKEKVMDKLNKNLGRQREKMIFSCVVRLA